MVSDNDSSSSPMSYSDMYNDDTFVIEDEEVQTASSTEDKVDTAKSADVDYGFDDEDALDFGGRAYKIPYMQDQSSVATGTDQDRMSTTSSVSSVPSVDQGRRPSSLLGGADDNSVVSAAPSVDSYGYSAVGSVAGSSNSGAVAPPPTKQILGTGNPTPYHNTPAPSVTGSMSTNPYYSYDESMNGEDDASVEMSLVTPEPHTPGRKNPFGKSDSTLQDSVKIKYVPAPPPILSKTARQSSTTEYPDNPDDEFGVSVVSSLHDDYSVQSSVKVAYVPSPFAQDNVPKGQMAPTSPLTPVFPDYPQQPKTLPVNAPMAPLPHGQMMDPSIPRPDSDSDSGVQVKHHSEYPANPFDKNNPMMYDYNSSYDDISESGHSEQKYHDEFLEKNQKKTIPRSSGEKSVSSSVATEKPKKIQTRENPFAMGATEDLEAAIGENEEELKKEKKMSKCRKCLCIFIPALLLILGGGGYYAYTKDFFGFDFFGLYDSTEDGPNGSTSLGSNPENPQDKTPPSDPQETDGGISFPNSPIPTAAPVVTEPPKGIIDDGTNSTNGGNNTNSTGDYSNSPTEDPLMGIIGTKEPHLTPVDTKPPTQSPSSSMTTAPSSMPLESTATPTIGDGTTTAPTTKAESEVMIQYRRTIKSFLETRGISFDTAESTTTVNALDRLMNDVVDVKFLEEEINDPFFEDIYRVTERFALYCLGVAVEEPAQEEYVTVFEVAEPWTPRSDPTPMYPLVFERLNEGETKSWDHCDWPGVVCSTGDKSEIVSITWNQQELDGTIPSEISLLQSLTSIDLANNYIHGTIPSQLYELSNLERLVLHHNYLEGQLNLLQSDLLTHLDLGHNLLSGNLDTLQSVQGLQFLNLNQNTFTGTIPDNLRLPSINYFDVGHNLLTGPLPTALPKSATQVRHIHLESNGFSGSLPIEYLWAGNLKLLTLKVNNNQLTGAVPAGGAQTMVQYTLENNLFTKPLDQETCELDQTLLLGGSVIEFNADCSICRCTGGVFCSSCNDG